MTYNTGSVREERIAKAVHMLGVHVELATTSILANARTSTGVELAMVKGILDTLHNVTKEL